MHFIELKDIKIFIPQDEYIRIALRLVLIVQLSALLFRSTSSMEIREALRTLLPKRIAENISLFICFIPEIFQTWTLINLAWKARGGKRGIAGIKTIVFILISVSMEKAALKAKALAARS
jgi:biotin transport system permease protein/energy-coupling factor transport system permease protein